jgi:hypothetical protein
MIRIFRVLIVATLLLQIVWFILPYGWTYLYEGDAITLLSWNNYGAYIDHNGYLPYLIVVAYIAASVGLMLFKKWARVLFLCLTIGTIVLTPFLGFTVTPALDASIGYIVSLADGAILALAYFTSVANELS